jgi:hypothetical protein
LATSCGAFGSRLGGVALALALAAAALALAAPPADARELSRGEAVRIAASHPAAKVVAAERPTARWVARYRAGSATWRVVLRPRGGGEPLAVLAIADSTGAVVDERIEAPPRPPRLDAADARRIAGREGRLRDWLAQYPPARATATLGDDRVWTVSYRGSDDEVLAEARVSDADGVVTDLRTGPQVEWQLARGDTGAYGRTVAEPLVFGGLCALFLAGLVNWRRPLSLRTLDMLALVSFAASLVWFNRGEIFVATPLVYVPLAYLLARMVRVGFERRPRDVSIGNRHALALVALTFGLIGFRIGLNYQDSNVIDVGYASVVGADRVLHAELPYGHMPQDTGRACGGYYANGDPIGQVQRTSGRCESVAGGLDTYGPSVYLAYVPFVAALGWGGTWTNRDLVAAHVAAAAFDLLAIAGLFVCGIRLRGPRLGVLLAFAWAANPFTAYTLHMNANDALVGALVAWLLALLPSPIARGMLVAIAGLTKFAPLLLVPLVAALRNQFATLVAVAATALALLAMLALDANGLRLFWERTIGYQLDRVTPMSIWTLGSFHPGWPDLTGVQRVLQGLVVLGAPLAAAFPRGRRDTATVAALAAALLIGAQAAASYWFYPYICWWLPAVLVALFAPRAGGDDAPSALRQPERLD